MNWTLIVKPSSKTPNQPVTLAQVEPLWEQGKSKAEIARALHTSGYYVDRVAKPAGLLWDRAQTEAATEARLIDAAAERVQLADAMRRMSAEGIRMAMTRTSTAAERKAGAIIAGIGAQRDMELSRFARDEKRADRQDEADQAIDQLMGWEPP